MYSVAEERFEELVSEALDAIPEELLAFMENVAVVIDDESPPGRLLGLYEGVPLTRRSGWGGRMPDKITIYKETICAHVQTEEELRVLVRTTVIHEVGHHFGISDARLHELGWA